MARPLFFYPGRIGDFGDWRKLCIFAGQLALLMDVIADNISTEGTDSPKPYGEVRLTFPEGERLRHRCVVTRLFEEGKGEYAYPLRMFSLLLTRAQLSEMFHGRIPADIQPLQMMITVPKKKFRHAVDRVWLRRRIREAYRLNRLELRDLIKKHNSGYSDGDKFLQLAFIYVGDERREYASMEKKMLKLLNKAKELIEPGPENRPVVPETDKPAAGSIKPVEDA